MQGYHGCYHVQSHPVERGQPPASRVAPNRPTALIATWMQPRGYGCHTQATYALEYPPHTTINIDCWLLLSYLPHPPLSWCTGICPVYCLGCRTASRYPLCHSLPDNCAAARPRLAHAVPQPPLVRHGHWRKIAFSLDITSSHGDTRLFIPGCCCRCIGCGYLGLPPAVPNSVAAMLLGIAAAPISRPAAGRAAWALLSLQVSSWAICQREPLGRASG